MARKYHEIAGLAQYTAKRIAENEQEWMKFLDSAAQVYKYPFKEQMLIYENTKEKCFGYVKKLAATGLR